MTDEYFLPLEGDEAVWVSPRDPISGRLSPYQWIARTEDIGFLGNAVNVLAYLPDALQEQVETSTCTTDVTPYLNAAHAAAGPFGRVYYPAGTYPCANVTYYNGQAIFGSGAATTILTKAGLASALSQSILVGYNYLNNITTQEAALDIYNMGFVADATSTGGYGIVCMARRPRIVDCAVTGNTSGSFGGMYFTTNTINRTPITNNNNLAGSSVTGCNFTNLTLGAIVAKSSQVVSMVNNVSITLNYATTGSGGTFSTYQDANSNTAFTGTSNGTHTILVANTTGISVGDQIRFGDTFNDFITDFYLHAKNTISNCGSADGTIFSIDSANMNGWNIAGNKFNNGPGGHLNCIGNCHSLCIVGNLFDYDPTGTLLTTNYCIQLQVDQVAGIVIVGNEFKTHNSDPTGNYIIVGLYPSYTQQAISSNNVVSCNTIDIPASQVGSFKAFQVTTPSILGGVATGNAYNYLYTNAQKGNLDHAWSVQTPLTTGLTAFATGGQGSATPLGYGVNEVSVCATNGDSVLLPPATGSGRYVGVSNEGAANCAVFPSTGDLINRGSANASVTVNSGVGAGFYDMVSGKWRSIP